jgi:hypothetical protein
MILAPLAAAALVMSVATGPVLAPEGAMPQMTSPQKSAAMQPLVRSTTQCIAHAVAANPRFAKQGSNDLGDLIVDSIPACVTTVRTMIDAYDRYFGAGAGEAFFMGPYLDVLPRAVSEWVSGTVQ